MAPATPTPVAETVTTSGPSSVNAVATPAVAAKKTEKPVETAQKPAVEAQPIETAQTPETPEEPIEDSTPSVVEIDYVELIE